VQSAWNHVDFYIESIGLLDFIPTGSSVSNTPVFVSTTRMCVSNTRMGVSNTRVCVSVPGRAPAALTLNPQRVVQSAWNHVDFYIAAIGLLDFIPTPHTLHPALYSLHPTPCTLLLTAYTLHPYTLLCTPYILHPTPYTLHSHPYTLNQSAWNHVDLYIAIMGMLDFIPSGSTLHLGFRVT